MCLISLKEIEIQIGNYCSYSKEIWDGFFGRSAFTLPVSIEEIIQRSDSPSPHKKVNTICKLLIQAIVYCLWRERNARLHTPNVKAVHVLIKEIQLLLRAKLFSLDRSSPASSLAAQLIGREDSFLLTWFRLFQN